MKKGYYLTIILIAAVLIAGIMLMQMRLINTEEKAIIIAQCYVKTIFGDEFDDYRIKAESDGGIWIVGYEIDTGGDWTDPGGGGPVLYILKANGMLLFFLFAI